MTGASLVAAGAAGLAAALLLPGRPRLGRTPVARSGVAGSGADDGDDWLRRHRLLLSLLAAVGAQSFLGGAVGAAAMAPAGVACWVVIGRAEPAGVRREREQVRAELPHVVSLLAAALRGGLAPGAAVRLVGQALPGPASARLRRLQSRLDLGGDPVAAWADLAATDAELAPLGRSMARAQRSGSSVVASVERLADSLAARARAEVEDRARVVGVKAAVPLGLCLLPAFVLLGIVPVVAGLLSDLAF